MTSSAPAQTPIANPRRLLILTPTAHSLPTIPPLLHSLTGVPVSDIPTTNPDPETETETGTETDTPQTQAQAQTFAGYTTHSPFHIENRYYAADVPVWVDEIPAGGNGNPPETVTGAATATTTTALAQWRTEFSSAEARIVRDAIGGVMVCIRNPDALRDTADPTDREDVKALKDFLRCIGDVKRLIQTEREGQDDDEDEDEDGGGGLGVGLGDVLGVIVLVEDGNRDAKPRKLVDGDDDLDADLGAGVDPEEPFSVSWWEDQLDDIGLMDFEVVSWDPRVGEDDSKDKYGEYRGMRRIRQILETHDWSANDPDDPEGDISRILGNNMGLDDDLEEHLLGLDSSHGFNLEVNELEREMLGLRMAIEHGDEEGQDDSGDQGPGDDEPKVESMEALMMRMQAIKDMSADLPENERRRFAAKAVRDIMKEI